MSNKKKILLFSILMLITVLVYGTVVFEGGSGDGYTSDLVLDSSVFHGGSGDGYTSDDAVSYNPIELNVKIYLEGAFK